ncbi:MAG: SRPBCC family protein [Ferruginibacter sp.]
MSNENELNDASADREIVSKRIFNFPRLFVFKAWEEPELLVNWWGPNGFTNTFHEFDFRETGNWNFTMHGPDGANYHNKSSFTKIIKPELIIFEHLMPMHKFQVRASFEDLGNKTRLIFRMLFETADECERVKIYVVDANEQNFDRLETVLYKMGETVK